jgi:Protein tyrosine and serine/threonine kinase
MADAVSAAAGDVVNNRYTLTERVADWGIGEVWRADDARFADRPVVVKLLPPGDAGLTPMVLARLEAARALRHPHVLPLVDHGVWNGREFAVHELSPLRSLGAWLDDHRGRGELPPLEDLKVVIAHLAAALGAAHRESPALIHEGLSPACVMLREGDAGLRARLFDFGIVPFADPIEADPGSARGVACMAPEQFQGEPADRRTDIFALGLLCFELLTALPDATSSERYRGRGDVPEAVWRALQTALTTERDGRYASVEAMLEALTPAWDQPLERVAHAAPAGDAPAAAPHPGDAPTSPHAVAAPSYDYAPSADDPRALRYQYTADDIAPELLSTTTAPVQIPAEVSAAASAYQLPELPEARTVSFDAAAIFAGVPPAAVADTLSTMRSNRDPRALMEMTRRYRMQAAAQAAAAPAPTPAVVPPPAAPPAPPAPAPRAPVPAPAAKPSGSRRVVVAVFAMLLSFGAVLGVVWLLFRARRH